MLAILKAVEYHEQFQDLAGVFLEDSWVLEVKPSAHGVSLRLEVVLTADHPHYAPPRAGEQHCYRNGCFELRSAEPLDIELSGAPPGASSLSLPEVRGVPHATLRLPPAHLTNMADSNMAGYQCIAARLVIMLYY